MPTIHRLYYAGELSVGASVELPKETSHRLMHVLRMGVGDSLVLFNGLGGHYHAKVVALRKHNATVELTHFSPSVAQTSLAIHLGQCVAKGDVMDELIQKAVELGVHELTPLCSDHSVVQLDPARWKRRWLHWRGIMIHACEQCERDELMTIHAPQSVNEWLPQQSGVCVALHPRLKDCKQWLRDYPATPESVSILVGPEGGLSEREVEMAAQSNWHFWTLGDRILRVETAAIAAVVSMKFKWDVF